MKITLLATALTIMLVYGLAITASVRALSAGIELTRRF